MILGFSAAAIGAALGFSTGCGGSDATTPDESADVGGGSSNAKSGASSSDAGGAASSDAGRASSTDAAVVNACGTNSVSCAGTCVDLKNDNANCGACGNVCGQGLACSDGKCPVLTITGGSYTMFDSDADAGISGSGAGASFTLLNERDASINLEWVDYSGVEQNYGDITPGGNLGMNTYVTHVWRVRDQAADGGVLGTFVLNAPDAYTVTAN